MTETMAGTYIYPQIAEAMQRHNLSAIESQTFLCGENNLVVDREVTHHKNPRIAENAIAFGKTKQVTPNPEQIRNIIEEKKNQFYSN